MRPVVYFRTGDWTEKEEFDACAAALPTVRCRTAVPAGSLVIPRYSMLPFPEELALDVAERHCVLINTVDQHKFVADIRRYYPVIEALTPRTWTTWAGLPEGAYVLKGTTNSRKHEWATRMYAASLADVPRVAGSLLDDDLIKSQGLVVREYVPLVAYGEGINGQIIANEWRAFVLDGTILAMGYYWANEAELCPNLDHIPAGAVAMVERAIQCIGDRIRFYVVDVAERTAGGWIVIELNDGCQSGLSMIDPCAFYAALAARVGGLHD